MNHHAAAPATFNVFESGTHLILCAGDGDEPDPPFSDPKVRWSRTTGAADCLTSVERGVADGVVIGTGGDESWAVQLLTAANPLARSKQMGLFVWAPEGAAEPKALYKAGAAEILEGNPVSADDVVRLWARLEALRSSSASESPVLRHGDLLLDPARFRAWRGERSVQLSTFQIELLEVMMRDPQHVFTRDELAATVWSGRPLDNANVRTCFRRLRRALNGPGERELVSNVRDRGYVLDPGQ